MEIAMTFVGMNFNQANSFCWLPRRIYRCYGPSAVKPSGTWVWLQCVETQSADHDANSFFGLRRAWGGAHALCGWGMNPGLIPSDADHCYIAPDRKRLIVAGRVVWEEKPSKSKGE